MGGMANLTSFSLLTAVITLFFCFLIIIILYICGTLPFTALEVNPTMTTSAAEKHANVKKVYRRVNCLKGSSDAHFTQADMIL